MAIHRALAFGTGQSGYYYRVSGSGYLIHYATNFNFLKVVFMKLTDLSQFECAEFKNRNQKFLSDLAFLQNSKQNYVIFTLELHSKYDRASL